MHLASVRIKVSYTGQPPIPKLSYGAKTVFVFTGDAGAGGTVV